MAGVATVAVGLRMASTPQRLKERYTWDSVNADYSYGIDTVRPWDVVILDEKSSEFIQPEDLVSRTKLRICGDPFHKVVHAEPPSTAISWATSFEEVEERLRQAEEKAEAHNNLFAPIKPEGAETTCFADLPKDLRDAYGGGANSYDDSIDRAFLTVAAISISQGMLGHTELGKPGFDGPWKEIEDEITTPRIITTSEEYYRELAS